MAAKGGGSYFHYFSFGFGGYIDRLLLRVRRGVYEIFVQSLAPGAGDRILDVGVSAQDHASSNYLERHYPHPGSIIGLSVKPYPVLRGECPGVTLVCGDGRALPLKTGAVDFVYSHAVIEHVGSRAQQAAFLAEALRVARKGVLITTPSRRHPLETHTGLPLLHYLPLPVCRAIYRALGKSMYAEEATLNLFTARELLGLAAQVGGRCELYRIRWLGVASNLVLVIRKDPRLR